MAKAELERNAEPSVLDRLIDEDPGSSAERRLSRPDSIRLVMDSVRRDLEQLLNTRRVAAPVPEDLPEVSNSLYAYGLPDLSSLSKDSSDVRLRLARQVEATISAFEPRLEAVRVTVGSNDRAQFGELRFVIEAMLKLDPKPERVTFDTVLDTGRGAVAVGGSLDA